MAPNDNRDLSVTSGQEASHQYKRADRYLAGGLVAGVALWGILTALQLWLDDIWGTVASATSAFTAMLLVIAVYLAPHVEQTPAAKFFQRFARVHEEASDAAGAVATVSRRWPLFSGLVGGLSLAGLLIGPYLPQRDGSDAYGVIGAFVGLGVALGIAWFVDHRKPKQPAVTQASWPQRPL